MAARHCRTIASAKPTARALGQAPQRCASPAPRMKQRPQSGHIETTPAFQSWHETKMRPAISRGRIKTNIAKMHIAEGKSIEEAV